MQTAVDSKVSREIGGRAAGAERRSRIASIRLSGFRRMVILSEQEGGGIALGQQRKKVMSVLILSF